MSSGVVKTLSKIAFIKLLSSFSTGFFWINFLELISSLISWFSDSLLGSISSNISEIWFDSFSILSVVLLILFSLLLLSLLLSLLSILLFFSLLFLFSVLSSIKSKMESIWEFCFLFSVSSLFILFSILSNIFWFSFFSSTLFICSFSSSISFKLSSTSSPWYNICFCFSSIKISSHEISSDIKLLKFILYFPE